MQTKGKQTMKQKGGTPKLEDETIQALPDGQNKKRRRGEKRKKNVKEEEREMK